MKRGLNQLPINVGTGLAKISSYDDNLISKPAQSWYLTTGARASLAKVLVTFMQPELSS
jgi:hypothetical protein